MNLTNIRISFCVPVYNVAKFIDSCIESILANVKEIDEYEILCIDDNSTDDSFAVLQSISRKYDKVKIFKNDVNRGVSYTRNELIRCARGSYIWFVDPDDMLYPGIVRPVLENAENYQVDALLGNYIRVPENCTECFCPISEITVIEKDRLKIIPTDPNGISMCAIWTGVFRRDFLILNVTFFNEKLIAQEDTLFYYEFSLKAKRIFCFKECAYLYRQRTTSVMHSRSPERAIRYYTSMHEMYRVYNEYYSNVNQCDEQKLLENKLNHMKQNLVLTLAAISDSKFVKREFVKLIEGKIYPYPHNYINPAGFQRLIAFLLPRKWGFWSVHLLYKIRYKFK